MSFFTLLTIFFLREMLFFSSDEMQGCSFECFWIADDIFEKDYHILARVRSGEGETKTSFLASNRKQIHSLNILFVNSPNNRFIFNHLFFFLLAIDFMYLIHSFLLLLFIYFFFFVLQFLCLNFKSILASLILILGIKRKSSFRTFER